MFKEIKILYIYDIKDYDMFFSKKMSDILQTYVPFPKSTKLPRHCSVCPQARQTRLPFLNSISINKSKFDLVHVDIWGPYNVPLITGARFLLTIVEDFSSCTWIFILLIKRATTDQIIKFYKMIQTRFGISIKTIKSDNGQKFQSIKL